MKLEVGKFYRTRDGRKAGPLEARTNNRRNGLGSLTAYPYHAAIDGIGDYSFMSNGTYRDWAETSDEDLVAEWSEPAEERIVREEWDNDKPLDEYHDQMIVEGFNRLVKAGRVQFAVARPVSGDILWAQQDAEQRLKPAKPRCLVLPDSGYVCRRLGETLDVGCRKGLNVAIAIEGLRYMTRDGSSTYCVQGLETLNASRERLLFGHNDSLTWRDADALLAFLNKAR